MTRAPLPSLRDESGFTLLELMLAITIMLVVLAGTLTTFTNFTTVTDRNAKVAQSEDALRARLDQITDALRNAAGTSGNAAVLRASSYDLVINTDRPGFGVTGGTAGTARYCLDSAASGNLWFGWTATPNSIPAASCPSAGWTNIELINGGVANLTLGKPLFSTTGASASAIRAARMDLYVTTHKSSVTTHLQSGAFFRSLQQTVPDPTTNPGGGPGSPTCSNNLVSLNLGSATDINGDPLKIEVFDGSAATGLKMATGSGSRTFTLPSGVHNLTVRITNVLGQVTDLNRTTTC
jgi:prepilin-type N-terminal cleavage/methylation domain-containing protein